MTIKEERRISIIKAAIKVIGEYGIEGAKMEEIAKEAGIGKGTIYEYFDSKTSLITEMTRYGVEQCLLALNEALEKSDNIKDKIANISSFFAEFMAKHIDIVNSSMSCNTFSEEMRIEMRKSWSQIHKTIERDLREAVKKAELNPNIDLEMATSIIIGGLHQYNMKKIFLDHELPKNIHHETIAKVILKGLEP